MSLLGKKELPQDFIQVEGRTSRSPTQIKTWSSRDLWNIVKQLNKKILIVKLSITQTSLSLSKQSKPRLTLMEVVWMILKEQIV